MVVALIAFVVVAVAAAVVARNLARAEQARRDGAALATARAAVARELAEAKLAAETARRAADTAARADALDARAAADAELAAATQRLDQRGDKLHSAESSLASRNDVLDARDAAVDTVHREVQSRRDRASGLDRDLAQRLGAARSELESRAHIRIPDLIRELGQGWLDDARARAADELRTIDTTTADPAHDREARRVMEIAAGRCSMHFLTERNASNLRCGPDIVNLLLADDAKLHAALQKVSTVTLIVNEDKDAVRMDGLDGVGKELVRRAIAKLAKKPESVEQARQDPEAWATRGREHLDQEIRALGKKAFQQLGIQRAHPEIVELVGALNFRTSYTQNQWLHAVEASFLAGMMASELGLDEKLARRATLMHDIGKALTHKIEGSHAVIGADIARRLGEPELVANAIGAHHADEPCNSVYAYLVAASDAMSGARPGARREMTDGFTHKVEDLERIGAMRRGVSHAHAVHGGRELRVYVRERDVDDLAVVEMSTEIAAQIADEMTFPGQIKVTVIRAFEATATAN
jgi:ribonuclease Y|nr:Rnase Y domain-containing protein [Kofleriaceae bacterium]